MRRRPRAHTSLDDRLWRLEELVDDLDLLGACPEACEGVHVSLRAVLGLDDLDRVAAVEDVRLVVDDESAGPVAPEDVEPPVQQHAVELEQERAAPPGRPRAPRPGRASDESQ